jgi:lysophospholipase L1-like esterase
MNKHQMSSSTTSNPARRGFLKTGAASLALAAVPLGGTAVAQTAASRLTRQLADRWVGTWGTGPTGAAIPPASPPMQFAGQTLRQIVHTSIGGSRLRVCFSNEFGTTALTIGAAQIARRDQGSSIIGGTSRALTFGGKTSIVIPPGAPAVSDPVDLQVPGYVDLAISLYLPQPTTATTLHGSAFQTNYIASGDVTGAVSLGSPTTTTSWYFLSGVSVWTRRAGALVAFGDSITDGAVSTVDANNRWPDQLARRLQAAQPYLNIGVVNKGIGGNRLLNPGNATVGQFQGIGPLFGEAALARFDRDVLATPGVEGVIVLLGVNDLGQPVSISPASEEVTAEDLIQGYRQLIARAHEHNKTIWGGTITPFGNTTIPNYYTPAREEKRQAVNAWIRNGGEFDAVVDFDAAIRDPAAPSQILPAYDSGDHLHPNDAGLIAMGNAVPLNQARTLLGSAEELDRFANVA